MKRSLMFACAMGFAAAALAQQYKWVDKDGKVRYGDTPPAGVKATPLKPPPAAPQAPAAAAGKDAQKPLSPEAAYRKRQEEKQALEQKTARESSDAETKRVNCEQSKSMLRTLQTGPR